MNPSTLYNHNTGNYLATKILQPLAKYYLRDRIEEVLVNKEREVVVKEKGKDWEFFEDDAITYDYIKKVCKILSNINKSEFSEEVMPIVSCQLPGLPFRFQAIMGPNVRYNTGENKGIGIAIRSLTVDERITLSSYGLYKGAKFEGAYSFFKTINQNLGQEEEDHIQNIEKIIQKHLTIIISGATSTGKTTFLNKLVQKIPLEERIITVEDTPELQVPHKNRLHLTVSRNKGTTSVGYNEVINALMRLTPDWILCGELSVENALPVYSLMGKGHPIITTVHSSTPEEAINAFINNMSSAGKSVDAASTRQNLEAQIGCIIQIDRRDGSRKVVDIAYPMKTVAEKMKG